MKHVIIGNGPAGVVAAEALRQADPAADIVLVGDEKEPPYSRMAIPYLLTGNIDEKGTYLRKDAGHYERLKIRLVNARAEKVDAKGRQVTLSGGEKLPYDRLVFEKNKADQGDRCRADSRPDSVGDADFEFFQDDR